MKKIVFLLSVLTFLIGEISYATIPDSLNQLLPVDDNVRIGKLDNGLTYYIRHNEKPDKRIEFRLAVNAGSILEDEEQLGLAHFIEHMCFNGTRNFKKNELTDYLQTVGVKFGADINAYTSFDETVYMLTVPSDSSELIDKTFLVLEDWAQYVTFDHDEIDKERGVVIEEWRMGQGPNQRIRDKIVPVIFRNSLYAERIPIGKKEIIENASYETIKSFYHDWYRPDLMAVVVVGDIDIDFAEEKIKDHFSGLKMPEVVRSRLDAKIPDHEETLVTVVTDQETPYTVIRLFYKNDESISTTYNDYRESIKENLFTGMLNKRLYELREIADPPFVGAGVVYSNLWARSKVAYQLYALVGDNGIKRGLQTLLEENLRVKQYGFSQGELDRYKKDLLLRYETAYKERDKTESSAFASEYIRNYLTQEPIPGISFEFNFVKNYIDGITLEEVNELAEKFITDNNEVIAISAPEKEGIDYPEEEELLAYADEVNSWKIENYDDKVYNDALMSELPERGEIIQRKDIKEIKGKEVVLSNGVRVIYKYTDFKNDEILLSAYSLGGYSLYNENDHFSALYADEIVKEVGIADYSNSDISKILSGKSAYIAPGISSEMETINGNSTPDDFESMLQLLYLYFTQPRVNEEAFNSFIVKQRDLYKNLSADPINYYFDQYNRIKSQNHPRGNYLPKEEDWSKIDYLRAVDIYKDRFADASDFVFIIVGSIDTLNFEKELEKYIGALPSVNGKEKYKDMGIRPPDGFMDKRIYKGNDPKSLVNLYFEKEISGNRKDAVLLSILVDVLNRKYIEILREELSGVYSVRTNGGLDKIPYDNAWLQIMLPCSPDNADSLIKTAINEIKKIQTDGVNEKDILKAREIYRRKKEENLEQNNFWLAAIRNCELYDYDYSSITDDQFIESITSDELKRIANTYINSNEYLKVVLYPEEYASTEKVSNQ